MGGARSTQPPLICGRSRCPGTREASRGAALDRARGDIDDAAAVKAPPSFLEALELPPADIEALKARGGKFLYLVPRAGTGRGTYHLRAASYDEIGSADFYLLTSSGVTRVRRGGPPEFTPLDAWEREYRTYNAIRDLPFFRAFRTWKACAVWKAVVRRAKMESAAAGVTAQSLLFVPALRGALLRVKALCEDASETKLFAMDLPGPVEISEFERLQRVRRDQVAASMRRLSGKVHEVARLACEGAVDLFLRENRIGDDHRLTFMERASLRSECRRLTRFLRLVDVVVINALRELAESSMAYAASVLSPEDGHGLALLEAGAADAVQPGGPPGALLRATVKCSEDGDVIASPSLARTRTAFGAIVEDALKVLSIPERTFGHDRFREYVVVDGDEAHEIGTGSATLERVLHADGALAGLIRHVQCALAESHAVIPARQAEALR